jgi:hypothetical protein
MVHATPINFIVPSQINAGSFTISSPGAYILIDDTTFSPGVSATAITISANNVTLDLNGKHLIGGNNNANTGIEIPASANDIIIKNGFISDFAGFGFRADAGTTYTTIILEDLTIRNRNKTGLGMSFGSATDSVVQRCDCSGANEGCSFSSCARIQILDSTFSNNIDFGMDLFSCQTFKIINCQSNFNVSNGGIGLSLDTCTDCIIRNGIFNGNVSTGALIGVGSQVFSSQCVSFYDSEFCRNSASATDADAAGIDVQDSTGVLLKSCVFNSNFSTTGTASGARISGTSHGNYFDSCISADNFSSTSTAIGFDLRSTTSGNYFSSCVALRDRSTTGTSAGFSVESGSISNIFKNCEAYNNTGGAVNYGFFDDNSTAVNWYAGALSFGHGSDTANFSNIINYVHLDVNALPATGTFDERGIDNISIA